MSIHLHPTAFSNAQPLDAFAQARLDFAIRLMANDVPVESVENLEAFATILQELRDALDALIDGVMWEMKARGTTQYDLKMLLAKTCPTLAALYRIEALADHRIGGDLTEPSRVAEIHDLVKQAIEDRTGKEFDNPIYVTKDARPSTTRRWAKIAAQSQQEE